MDDAEGWRWQTLVPDRALLRGQQDQVVCRPPAVRNWHVAYARLRQSGCWLSTFGMPRWPLYPTTECPVVGMPRHRRYWLTCLS